MATPIVRFVDSPSTTATLRYDFNVSNPTLKCFPLHEGIDLGTPSFTGEPEGVGGFYGYRQMRFTQRIIGTRAVALARMSLLAKEIFRAQNWLRFQWDPSMTPVFFKTYRTEPGAMSLENAGNADAWDIVVPIEADGLAYGPRQTLSALQIEQTIPTDLDASWNALTVALPALKGDAPTDLRLALSPAVDLSTDEEWMVGCISGASTMSDPAFDIGTGDGYTAGTGTSAGSSNAAYVGGTYRTVTIAANDGGTGTSLASRLTGTVTTTLPQGRYKLLLRYEADITTTAKTYLFKYVNTGATATWPVVPVAMTYHSTTETQQGWVDLGDFSFPFGIADLPTDSGLSMPTTVNFEFWVGTSDNSAGTVRLDAFKFIPVTGPGITRSTIMKTQYLTATTSFRNTTWDGDSETVWLADGAPRPPLNSLMENSGSFLIADPASDKNLLVVMATKRNRLAAHATGVNTSRKAQATATVSYFPRYLHIGDGT